MINVNDVLTLGIYLTIANVTICCGATWLLLRTFMTAQTPTIKRLQVRLSENKEQLKAIADSVIEAIVTSDEYGIILSYNKGAEKVFQWTTEEVINQETSILIPEKYHKAHLEGLKRLRLGGEPRMLGKLVELEGRRKDGTIFPMELSVVRTEINYNITYTAVMRDISERKTAIEKIEQLNKALELRLAASEAFNQTVSHDLNAPMRSIQGFAEALEEDYSDKLDEQGKNYLRRMNRAIRKMQEIIRDMMKLAIVTQPETQLNLRTLSLSNLVRVIAAEYRLSNPDRNVILECPDDMMVNVDPDLFGLLISNLLSNSYKFTAKNPHAKIQVGKKVCNGETVYYVKDNGVGFDQQQASSLFQPFHRLHKQEDFEGSGIGLSIVKRVADLHKGRVWAEGIPDKGATFYFTIGT